ncbi:glycosyltransferase family 2 protein (plasmid) [Microvirga sp. RSM25]|uniref:glycosyltransferase family 2 protein n=1 Tax=Microvirga sp. RSM25 TaxID=3273802 RepID=UPI0038516585
MSQQVEAVTGALMALSARLFRDLEGLDTAYERGDFEDADLCLRARQRGAQIWIHVRPGLYHLERQSIRRMGDPEFREMITYMNCVEFNFRWDARLSEGLPLPTGSPVHSDLERRMIGVRKRDLVRSLGAASASGIGML